MDPALWDILADRATGCGDRVWLVDKSRVLTFAQAAREAEAVAEWLHGHGIRRGDRVVVHMRKCFEEVVAIFAAARLGAVFVDVHPQWTTSQLDSAIRDCSAKALLVDQRRAEELATVGTTATLKCMLVKGDAPNHPLMSSWTDLGSAGSLPPPTAGENDLATLLYTSGTTGCPKAVMHTHRNLLQWSDCVAKYLDLQLEDRLLGLLPLSFSYGLSQLLVTLLAGATLVLQKVAMASDIFRTLLESRITGMAAVPYIWAQLVRYQTDAPTSFPCLRFITSAGDKAPDVVLEQLPRIFPESRIFLMYGTTETLRTTYLPPEWFGRKCGSIGRAIPGVETYVVDRLRGLCQPGQTGELIHRGGSMAFGYWGDPEGTRHKFRPCPQLHHLIGDEVVYHTGDLVRMDEDGFLWHIGRDDALLKTAGFRISPSEIEAVLARSPLVFEAVAFGVPEELLGQAVEIAVSPPPGTPCDLDGILRYCRLNLPSYMVPRRLHAWNGGMPRLPNGKLDRAAVTQAFSESRIADVS
jgi:amino acid adenylation domain-containing protein